jgi:hypothetical protein
MLRIAAAACALRPNAIETEHPPHSARSLMLSVDFATIEELHAWPQKDRTSDNYKCKGFFEAILPHNAIG